MLHAFGNALGTGYRRAFPSEIEPGPGFTTPAAFEAAYYRQQDSADPAETQTTEPL